MPELSIGIDGTAAFWSRRLIETQRWCAARPNGLLPALRFRSEELDPRSFLGSRDLASAISRFETGDAIWQEPAVVSLIAGRRADLLAQLETVEPMPDGRVAVYRLGMNLLDRLAYDETSGFIDYSDCPGWDTWIGLLHREPGNASFPGINDSLAFWVPDGYEPLLVAANAVCSCPTLCWIEEFSGDIDPTIRLVLSGG